MPLPPAPPLKVKPKIRRELVRVLSRPTAAQRTTKRARIVLDAANGVSNAEIARKMGISRQRVADIRRRFEERGIASILGDAPGRGRPREIRDSTVAKVVGAVLKGPPKNATHWSSRALAERFGMGASTVQRILRAHNLKPHRWKTFKFSADPDFATKLRDVVGLYMNPPTNAVVLSVDEKSGTRRSVPAPARRGTTTLFAALNTLSGKVLQTCQPHHTHVEFIEFLKHIDRNVPKRLDVHAIMDNYATHKHPTTRAWLEKHPRFHVHFTPTSSSWLNAIERFFSEITSKRIRRGSFPSVPRLVKAIADFVEECNTHAKPFVWTKSAKTILDKIEKCHAIYGSQH
ncbi:MAG TPA: IS630 family transposase [Candidatus Cybelea sp.]|nr:IS630 family transposase [Candidatus Cybelea sp.]